MAGDGWLMDLPHYMAYCANLCNLSITVQHRNKIGMFLWSAVDAIGAAIGHHGRPHLFDHLWIHGPMIYMNQWNSLAFVSHQKTEVYCSLLCKFSAFQMLKDTLSQHVTTVEVSLLLFPPWFTWIFPNSFRQRRTDALNTVSRGWHPTLRNVALSSIWPKMNRQVQGWVNIPIPGRPKGTDPILKRVN